jgi:putative polyketide hydroxylase
MTKENVQSAIDVAIIGGGPCGMYAALLLARAGVHCAVFEQKAGISKHPKAMGITRRTAELFRQCGLHRAIEEGALDLDGRDMVVWARTLLGEELGRVPMAELHSASTPCQAMHCPQPHTERVLLDSLEREARVHLHWGARVEDAVPGGDFVELSMSDGRKLRASWVIAADGAGSHTRKALDIGTDGPGDLGHFVNVLFKAPYGDRLADRKALLYNIFGDTAFEFFVAVDGHDHWLMHHFLQPGETPEQLTAERAAEIIRAVSGMPEVPVEVLGMSPWVMSPKVAKQWRSGRTFLVGDAAARLSPAGGLGLNTGLQGVHNLAWKLACVVKGSAPEMLLDSYHDERRPVALELMKGSNKNADEIFVAVAAALRGDWETVRAMAASSGRAGSGIGRDLGTQYPQGAFLPDGSEARTPPDPVNQYMPDARPGARAPHVPLPDPHRPSILDFFGGGFVALGGKASGASRTDQMAFFQNGLDFEAPNFEAVYGIGSAGVVLVRPDGVVGARFAGGASPAALSEALQHILGGQSLAE